MASGAALLWRLHHDLDPTRREHVERIKLRIVGCGSLRWRYTSPTNPASPCSGTKRRKSSIPGIVIATSAVIVMPLLAKAKHRVAAGIGSGAMHADSRQADFCAYLSAILLGGLLLNAVWGRWWADHWRGS